VIRTLLHHPFFSRTSLAVFLALCMIAGFMCNRVVLSVSMILFGLNALRGVSPRQWLQQRWWLLGLVWVAIYALSWFWSDDKTFWNDRVQTKMPFLLLPLAFGLLPAFSQEQLRRYTAGLCLLLLGGIVYSLSFMLNDPAAYVEGYRQSHILRTPAHGDHIRFSMTVAAAVAWCLYMAPKLGSRLRKGLLYVCITIFIVYLHVLAAKTGLIAFYLLMACWALYQFRSRKSRKALLVLLLVVGAWMLAIRYVPTLRYRIDYSLYSLEQLQKGNISGDYSDIGRLVSYKLAMGLIREHPLTGVGAGDILSAMSAAYDRLYPDIPQAQRLVPHNQFLAIAVATGLISLAFFCWWLCAPLARLRRDRESFFFLTTWLMLLVVLMTDASLEVQFGVFVYLFFLLWQRQVSLHAAPDALAGA